MLRQKASTQSTNQLTTVQPSIHMRSAAKMQRPSTASQALKLLKKRHPKLLKRRSSSMTSNGSPMSVMASKSIFESQQQKRNNFLVVNNNKENGKSITRTNTLNGNNIYNATNVNKNAVKHAKHNINKNRMALSTINTKTNQELLSSPPPPPPKSIRNYNVASTDDVFENNASSARERAPTWEEEQAAVYMPSEQLVRVECPHCSRKFAKEASKRHIEVCANTKNKPKAPPKQVAAFTDRLGVRRGGRGKLSCTFNEKAEMKLNLGLSGQQHVNGKKNVTTEKHGDKRKKSLPKKKDTRERLSRLWGEIMFLLRKPITNEYDLNTTLDRALRGYNFLNDLEKAAFELNILQGTLSRYLLPFNNKTSVADQAANNDNEFGSSELDGLLSYTLRRKLVKDATDLRSLIRVKIADDADLLQAKESLKHIMKFGRSLMRIAKNDSIEPYQLLKLL
jgi:hypothetical protein